MAEEPGAAARRDVLGLMLVAGAAGRTLELVAAAYLKLRPDAGVVSIDIESLVYDAHRRDALSYHGPGRIVPLSPAGAPATASEARIGSIVTLLRRGPKIAKPALDVLFRLIGRMRPVSDGLVARAEALIAREGIGCLVTCNDGNTSTRSVLLAARRRGVPTILVQEGPFTTIERRRHRIYRWADLLRRRLGIHADVYAGDVYGAFGHDRLLVASQDYASRFRAAGIAVAALEVVGVPRFDVLVDARTRRRLPVRRTLTYVFQPFLRQGRVAGPALGTLLALVDGVNMAHAREPFDFVLRAHPRADPVTLAALEARLAIPFTRGPADFQDALLASTAAIGHYSTGLLEALALDVPIVCVPVPAALFDEAEEAWKQAWFERLGVPCARDPAGIADAIGWALAGGEPQVPAERWQEEAGIIDGQASERAAQAIARALDRTR